MNNKIRKCRDPMVVIIASAIVLLVLIGASGQFNLGWSWLHWQAMALDTTDDEFSTRDDYTILVLYLRDGQYFLDAISGDHDFKVQAGKLYMDGEVIVENADEIGWEIYPDQPIIFPSDWEGGNITIAELPIGSFPYNLPQDAHCARLDKIYPGRLPKGKVSMYWNHQWFSGIRCAISLQAFEDYEAGKLQIGDFVVTDYAYIWGRQKEPIIIDKVFINEWK